MHALRTFSTWMFLSAFLITPGCGGEDAEEDMAAVGDDAPGAPNGAPEEGTEDESVGVDDGAGDDSAEDTAGADLAPLTCTTRVTYGDAWIRPASHPAQFDDASGTVTWDGTCTNDGTNSYAVLSNGWKPYFTGRNACVLALDTSCDGAPTSACSTRITYGPAWSHPANHPAQYDDIGGRVYWDRTCTNQGTSASVATLSNGWAPHFTGTSACAMSFRYANCGGLYQNPVINGDCADPGVIYDGGKYITSCTSGGAASAFHRFTSPDLVRWTAVNPIFPSGQRPSWGTGDFWAPEIHRVGTQFVAYFTARHTSGKLSIGAATSSTALGTFTDIGQPLVHNASMGMIDATKFEGTNGKRYLVWKADGNAVGQPTPIYGQELSANGTSLVGARATLITNDLSWEGGVVEGPWVVAKNGYYYLFYSGNAYYNSTYAVGVARATSPLGPYTKLGAPILKTNATWVGPGHCSVVDTPGGNTTMVYHAWRAGHVNGPGDQRLMLIDGVVWSNGWPSMPGAPSVSSRPTP
ncbi:glycoside hydrolase family 43 protein [Chondromyces apiculatus]|uniref:Beta-xylosidase n=1 Tax=Chondromyces apiculatus DSM 436 TaxID=1192034 RepID=A0A017T8B5_9BACT|nr:glycoside hydrolase family 43 protein [Chondromyces apiculatus]EYF05479.1 Beta-xylosidase [Chondromyces apiculatus DSM 436]